MAVGDYYRESATGTTQGTATTVWSPGTGSSKRYIILAATIYHSSGESSEVRVEVGGDTVWYGRTEGPGTTSAPLAQQVKGHVLQGDEAIRVVNLHSSGNAVLTVSLLEVA